MKTLKDYIYEASLLDIEGTIEGGEEAVKKSIENWINDNFNVHKLIISNSTNKDSLYEVSASFVVVTNKNIKSLTNGLFVWKEIINNFYCNNCPSLKSLEGAPEKVGIDFNCSSCKSLKSIEGAPKEIGGDFSCSNCISLKSLEGLPKEIWGNFYCYNCNKLISLEGAPEKVYGLFDCSDCSSLTSLEGAPIEVDGLFDCSYCKSLKSLKGAPEKVGRNFYCSNCKLLKSKDLPATTKIKGNIIK